MSLETCHHGRIRCGECRELEGLRVDNAKLGKALKFSLRGWRHMINCALGFDDEDWRRAYEEQWKILEECDAQADKKL